MSAATHMQVSEDGAPDGESCADVVIIGGGPAGLTAAIYLARFRRSVVLLDAKQSRLSKIPLTHNYPGFADGISGGSLLETLQSQLQRYPVRTVEVRADRVEHDADRFTVHTTAGAVRARLLLLATGVTDIPPVMPQVQEAVGSGALRYCPVCDAYEVIGQAVGVYADGATGVAEALYLRHFTADIVLFMDQGAATLTAAQRRRLANAGIGCPEEAFSGILHHRDHVVVVHGPRETRRDTLYCALGLEVHAQLALALGARTDEGGYVVVDAHHATNVQGLYAIGDVAQGLNQIAVAAGGAAIAASAIHRHLAALG